MTFQCQQCKRFLRLKPASIGWTKCPRCGHQNVYFNPGNRSEVKRAKR